MTLTAQPNGWVEVPVAEFEEFLKTCNDYVRDSYCGSSSYRYRHNDKVFARAEIYDRVERVFVPPEVLEVH